MLKFHPLSLSDKHWIMPYLFNQDNLICDYSFANLFLWKHLYHTECTEEKGYLLIHFYNSISKQGYYMEPLGEGSLSEILNILKEDAHQRNETLRIMSISANFTEKLKSIPEANDLFLFTNRDYANYIYDSSSLSTLSGKHLNAKRNHIRQFTRFYPNYTSRPLLSSDAPLALSLFDEWKRQKSNLEPDHERLVIEEAFANFEILQLEGILLFVDNKPIAFTFGSPLNSNTFCIHVEKANILYQGAFAMINKIMAQTLCDRFQYINREEDMGLLNLRKSKLSYHPQILASHTQTYEKNSDEVAVWKLWKTCFNDSDEFIFSYMSSYSTAKSRVLLFEKKELISMFHVHFFISDWGKVAYLYGLGTEPLFRGKGLAAQVIETSIKRAKEEGSIVVWVIQENKNFKSWNSPFDFMASGSNTLHFETPDGFDFGGDAKNDWGLCRILAPQTYLEKYVNLNPEAKIDFDYFDSLFPELSGHYQFNQGKITFTPSLTNRETSFNSKDLISLFPLEGGVYLKYLG